MKQHFLFVSLTALSAATLSSPAFAQDEGDEATSEESPEPTRKMDLSVAPPAAPVQRTDFMHEGFYFRAGAGAGLLSTSLSPKDAGGSNTDTSFSLGSDLLIGGSPTPGLALGGGALADLGFANDPSLAFLAGPFFDTHPYNKGGWHVGGMLGFAGTVLSDTTMMGGGGALWGGHDIWIAPEWSVGLGTRVAGARVFDSDFNGTNFSLHFTITILNH